ncbi:MAG: DUF2238 domain-containing protein [Spirochaetia bacterium]|nr:DUF2238 domain-containing protein [Spirochaetia bacterium]
MKKLHFILAAVFFLVLAWSAFTWDHFTWILETAPGMAAFVVLALTFRRFRFTGFTYCFILIHCIILFVGAKYTYAQVPLFNTLKDIFHMGRNNYDKVGHFAQGFIPAMVARELILRLEVLKRRGWLVFFVVSVCLAVSALYELIEWLTAELSGEAADAFLGTQGYVWDTQSDRLCAMVARDLILRLEVLKRRGWLAFFVVSVCLAVSALYELIEWLTAELSGEAADAFLGTQGYVWDTQSDMLCALVGAIAMLVFFSRLQDRAIAKTAL